jgi:hypothetical protein
MFHTSSGIATKGGKAPSLAPTSITDTIDVQYHGRVSFSPKKINKPVEKPATTAGKVSPQLNLKFFLIHHLFH